MPIYKKRGLISIIVIIVFVLLIFIKNTQNITYYIQQDSQYTDNSNDIVIVKGADGYTGRFPDIVQTNDGLLAAYYWNNTHAPYVLGDSLGIICLVHGSKDGKVWDTPVNLIDKQFLIDNGLGLWKDKNKETFYYSYNEAIAHNAEFCIEARDPNFAVLKDKIILSFQSGGSFKVEI